MLRTVLASSNSLHDRWRQVIHTTSRHASDVSMVYIAGFRVRGLPVRDANGRIFRWCSLLTDIDERSAPRTHSSAVKRF